MDAQHGPEGLHTIGELARRTGLSVKTIRFYADEGIVPPTARSAAGYRLYDAEAAARLDLVRTLRELGFGLPDIRGVLDGGGGLDRVAAAHAEALDARIRILRLRRAVLRTIARKEPTAREISLMNRLAQLSAEERQAILDDYHDHVFGGLDMAEQPAAKIRSMRVELPDDPTPEQVDAWVELAELVQDPGFRERTRQMAEEGARAHAAGEDPQPGPEAQQAAGIVIETGRAALEAGTAPDSAEGRAALAAAMARLTGADPSIEDTPQGRARLADDYAVFTDARVERYYRLLGQVNGWPAFEPSVPAFEWFIAALRASAA
ncbi:MerR family transcriptional regulator [Nocardiopsis potens]|uniref:MerR family transcriptional regulator n=1 Tax=Nocardiopsis potens TaxID=1246458 RepID=UPI000378FE9B|nr:MerR family transcriptional regulator [Nocardiopsis potens]